MPINSLREGAMLGLGHPVHHKATTNEQTSNITAATIYSKSLPTWHFISMAPNYSTRAIESPSPDEEIGALRG